MNAPRRNMMLADALAQVGAVGLFMFSILAAVPKSLRHYRETVRQVWFVGAMSLVIIMTCGLFVGMVLSLQLYYVLTNFGGTAALGTVVALSMFRELGPVVTALLFAGRAGTSMTAEIGLMRATDQLSAMEMMAVDPMSYVVAPRFLAGILAMPLLVCIFNALGLLGAHLVGVSPRGSFAPIAALLVAPMEPPLRLRAPCAWGKILRDHPRPFMNNAGGWRYRQTG
jgi:phospholipid/cholesterol/gamma-HCH transport system permease protein